MGQKGRITLKEYFKSETIPTEDSFSDFIDSSLNKTDDQIFVKPVSENEKYGRNIGIGTTDPQSPLSIRNRTENEKLLGFENIGGEEMWNIAINPAGKNGLNIQENKNSNSNLFIQTDGNVGIGTTDPKEKLDVIGSVQITGTKDSPNYIRFDNTANASGSIWKIGTVGTPGENEAGTFSVFNQVEEKYFLNILPNGNVGIGTTTPEVKLDVKGAISGFGIVPLGSITAWHKSFAGIVLPDGWVECNGQKLNDSNSPFHNQMIPDLNNAGRFLRGATASGVMQDDAFQGHNHMVENSGNGGFYPGGTFQMTTGNDTYNPSRVQAAVSNGVNGTPRTSNETRPINMSVVWIMRIK